MNSPIINKTIRLLTKSTIVVGPFCEAVLSFPGLPRSELPAGR